MTEYTRKFPGTFQGARPPHFQIEGAAAEDGKAVGGWTSMPQSAPSSRWTPGYSDFYQWFQEDIELFGLAGAEGVPLFPVLGQDHSRRGRLGQ